jgi:hypothetical protein
MGLPKFLGSNFWSFAFTFRAAVLLAFGEVGAGVEEDAAGVGAELAGDVGAGCGDDPALQAAADATTNALATANDPGATRVTCRWSRLKHRNVVGLATHHATAPQEVDDE